MDRALRSQKSEPAFPTLRALGTRGKPAAATKPDGGVRYSSRRRLPILQRSLTGNLLAAAARAATGIAAGAAAAAVAPEAAEKLAEQAAARGGRAGVAGIASGRAA